MADTVLTSKRRLKFGAEAGPRDLHLVQYLNQMAIGYTPRGIIADTIFPVVRVMKQLDAYPIFSRQEALTIENTTRSPGTQARKITRSVSSATYFAKNYALKSDIVLEDRINMDAILATQFIGGRSVYLLNKLMLDWDKRVSNLVNSTTNVGSSATVSSAWNGAGNPLGNAWTAIDNVRYSTGYKPNKMIFGTQAFDAFSRDITVRNLIFGLNNGGGYVPLEKILAVFGIEKGLIGSALYATANEAQPENLAVIWPDNFLVTFSPDAPTIDDPSFGYTFRWAAPGLPELNVEVHPYDDKIKADEVEVGFYQAEQITGASYGFIINNVNSSH